MRENIWLTKSKFGDAIKIASFYKYQFQSKHFLLYMQSLEKYKMRP